LFYYGAIMQHDNEVGIPDCTEAMSDNYACAGKTVQVSIYQAFGRYVQMTGRLVEKKKRRPVCDGARDREALALASG
jgi:hypothetical protein